MARPINPTPILKGKDAKEVEKDLKRNKLTNTVFKYLEKCEKIFLIFIRRLK